MKRRNNKKQSKKNYIYRIRKKTASLFETATWAGSVLGNMDKSIGSVNIGKNADLIILNKNLSNIKNYNELIEVKVIHTIINGDSKYRLN